MRSCLGVGTADWWAQVDSNHRPRAYQARALTTWAMSPYVSFRCISFLSNRHKLYLSLLVEMMGFEPMTPCLQGRCSPNWATPPYIEVFLWVKRSLKIEQQASRTAFLRTALIIVFGFCLFTNYNRSNAMHLSITFSIERRWSSRTFRYGYLVTT